MEPNDHLRNLHDKLNSKPVIQDLDSLWDELEPRLPKKKRRRYLFLFIPVLLLLACALLNYNNSNDSKHKTSDKKINVSKYVENEIETETKKSEKKNTSNSEQVFDSDNKNININQQLSSHNKEKINLQKRNSQIKNSIYQDQKGNIFNNQNSNTTNLNNTNFYSANENLRSSTIKNKLNSNIESQQFTFEQNEFIRENTDKDDETLIPLKNPIANIELIQVAALSKKLLLVFDIQNTSLLIFPTFAEIKQSLNQNWEFILSTHFVADFNQKAQQNLTPYGETINELTTIKAGYTYGSSLLVSHRSGIFGGIGIERTETFEKFRLNSILTSTQIEVNEEAFSFNGEFISQERETTRTIRQDVLVYNSYFQTNILPLIGYKRKGIINYSISASPILNLNRNYDGYLISKTDELTTDISSLYQSSNLAYNGFALSAVASKRIWRKLDIGLRTQFKNLNTLSSESNTDFKTGLKSYSIGLDFRISLY